VFLVEANSYESLCLWRESAQECEHHLIAKPVAWQQESEGLILTIGELAGMPVTLSLTWHVINGCRVLFWYMPSMATDSRMAEAWLAEHCSPPMWDSGTRPAQCDAMNFHHCLAAIAERPTLEKES
jgi:hypothetical protein